MAVNSICDPGLHNEVYYVGTFNTSTTEPVFFVLFVSKQSAEEQFQEKKKAHSYLLMK